MNDPEYNRLSIKLKIFLCHYLQVTERPPVSIEEFKNLEVLVDDRYRNDPVFYEKVQYLTGHILRIVKEASHG